VYEALEPFGERGQYWRAAQICATVVNSQRAKRSDPIATAEDFMPRTFTEQEQDEDQPSDYQRLKTLHESVTGTRS
jgi:hypothetical protein